MLPNTAPKMTREELLALLAQKHPSYKLPDFCIVGIRGYYKRTMGNPTENDRAIYDDAIFIVSKDELHSFNGNTDPSKYKSGIAKLTAGIWPCYRFDTHRGKIYQYPAICQRVAPVIVTRDEKAGQFEGIFGINIHKGGFKTTSSEGCQTIPPKQWERFYKTAQRIAMKLWGDEYNKKTITYILIEN